MRETVTMTLVEFLTARLDEDEAVAAAASPGPWHPDDEASEVIAVDGEPVAEGFALSGPQLRATVEHVARHDPARVLREVEAKRAILARACEPIAPWDGWSSEGRVFALRHLVAVYTDHPDYDAAWRP